MQNKTLTSWSSLGGGGGGGGGGVGRFGGLFLAAATCDGRNCPLDGTVSGGNGGNTATPRPSGRAPLNPTVPRSGTSPGASGFSSTKSII